MKRISARAGVLRVGLLVLAAALAPRAAHAQEEGTPAWVVARFYAREPFLERGDYLAGEMAEFRDAPTPGSALPEGARVTIRPLQVGSDRAVVAVTVSADATSDAYLFLQRSEGRWQVTAFRALALPPLFYMAMEELRALPARTAEDERMLRNLQLTAASDSALKAYFAQHRPAIEALGREAAADGGVTWLRAEPADDEGALSLAQMRIRERLRALDLEAVGRDEEASGCVLVHIGGMLDNAVGYLYAPQGCRPPEMTPGHFIYVEELAPGWYLYKTT